MRGLPSTGHDNAYGRKEQQAHAFAIEVRNACAQVAWRWFTFLTLRSLSVERDTVFVKKSITINGLVKSVLGFSIILGGCAAIFVGVAGGYRSPLSPPADAAAADAAAVDVHTANLIATSVNSGTQAHY